MNPTRKLKRNNKRKLMVHCRNCKKVVVPERKYIEDESFVYICPICKMKVNYGSTKKTKERKKDGNKTE